MRAVLIKLLDGREKAVAEIITAEAMNTLARASGGVMRELIRLFRDATRIVRLREVTPIDEAIAQDAVGRKQQEIAPRLNTQHREALRLVLQKGTLKGLAPTRGGHIVQMRMADIFIPLQAEPEQEHDRLRDGMATFTFPEGPITVQFTEGTAEIISARESAGKYTARLLGIPPHTLMVVGPTGTQSVTLVDQWMSYRRVSPEGWDVQETLQTLLPEIAWHLHATTSTGLIGEQALHTLLVATLRTSNPRLGEQDAHTRAAQFRRNVSEFSGIFLERGLDQDGRGFYGFLHLTFEEYFAAVHLAEQWHREGEHVLTPLLHNARWTEVLLLAGGRLSVEKRPSCGPCSAIISRSVGPI